jgi:LPXTG-motif cell wall-anchored protein
MLFGTWRENMKHLHKQLLASAVAVTMACSMMPAGALAAEESAETVDIVASEITAEMPEVPMAETEESESVEEPVETAEETEMPEEAPAVTEEDEQEEMPTEEMPAEEMASEETSAAEQVAEEPGEPLYNPEEKESESELPTKPEMPVKPNTEGMTVEEANAAINAYNAAVEEYNKAVDAYNNAVEEKYASEQQVVSDHNAAEDEKVQLSDEAIAAYEELKNKQENNEKLIVEFDKKGIQATSTTDADDLPSTWENYVVDAEDAKTIVVKKSPNPTGNQYYVINIHIYLDEGWDGIEVGTSMDNDTFQIAQNKKDHMVKAEWEAVLVDENDIVTVHGQNSNMGYSSMRFYRYMPGYINGTWIGSPEFASTCKNVTWSPQGQTFSYDQGTTDRKPIKNVFNMYTYSFYRKGAELVVGEKPDAYVPEYMEDAEKGELLAHLDAMDLIEEPEPDTPVEPDEPVNPDEPVVPDTPDEPVVPDEPAEPAETKSEEETQPAENNLPQTGQDWMLTGALALAGASVLAFCGMKKRRHAENER